MALIALDWPAPETVKAFYTTRAGGFSQAPYDSFNLALHVNDAAEAVQRNRQQLLTEIQQHDVSQVQHVQYLQQVHGTDVVDLDEIDLLSGDKRVPAADAAITSRDDRVCLVMTADCLPVFFTDIHGDQVAVAHAGWRGLVGGILARTIERFRAAPGQLMAYLGPAIGPAHFEIGPEVKQRFLASSLGSAAQAAFEPSERTHHYYADLYQLARLFLHQAGVQSIFGGGFCTYTESQRFYSYRRDGETGRMASLILKTSLPQ